MAAEFDPWGNQVDGSNPLRMYQPIRMQGQHFDEESGLHYNRHRYYDPTLGRYITQDPIGLLGGWNPYDYAINNPMYWVDPLGLTSWGNFANLGTPGIKPIDSQPPIKPMMRSISVDIGYALSAFTGASDSYGASLGGSSAPSIDYDICGYHTICNAEGIGLAAGGAITGTMSASGVSSGETTSEGYTAGGGYLGKLTVTATQDSSGNNSESIGVGPGVGAFVGKITCNQSSHCLIEWIYK
ncbi:Cell wall-associated polypeptide CWBP200 [Campylobacter jejuni]|nr:Cell wall-associated polypeptide CWBP200 [Campylobacter jejuni]